MLDNSKEIPKVIHDLKNTRTPLPWSNYRIPGL